MKPLPFTIYSFKIMNDLINFIFIKGLCWDKFCRAERLPWRQRRTTDDKVGDQKYKSTFAKTLWSCFIFTVK